MDIECETEDVWRGTYTVRYGLADRMRSMLYRVLIKRLEKYMCDAWDAEECDAVL